MSSRGDGGCSWCGVAGPVEYIQCLVCGRVTPVDRGVCYHCGAPLPSEVRIPAGTVVCPSCLRVTPVDRGFCRRCGAPLPGELVEAAAAGLAAPRLGWPAWVSSPGSGGVRVLRPGRLDRVLTPGTG